MGWTQTKPAPQERVRGSPVSHSPQYRAPFRKALVSPAAVSKTPTCLPSNKFSGNGYQPPKLHQKTTTWKLAFSTATNYMTFIMRYGCRIVPTDRALAGCPPRPPPPPCPMQRGRFCLHLQGSSRPCCQQAHLDLGGRWLPVEVSLHETHTLIHHGVGACFILFFWLLKKLCLTSGSQISPRS